MKVTQFQSWIGVHPDHVGFVIGSKGATVKKIANDTKCWIRIQEPNQFSNFPWFLVKGDLEANVCEAYHRLQTIANEAEKRLPRFQQNTSEIPKSRPRTKLNVEGEEKEQEKEVSVKRLTDSDGVERLVDEITGDVYDSEGRLIGWWKDGDVFAREDQSE